MIPITRLQNGVQRPVYVQRRASTKEVLHQFVFSNTAGAPNPDPDSDLEYLQMFQAQQPDFDADHFTLESVGGPNEVTVPPQWEIKHNVNPRPLAERLARADNVARFEVQRHIPTQDFYQDATLALAAVLRLSKGLQLEPDEQLAADRLVARAAKLKQNVEHLAQLKEATIGGGTPKFSEGWAEVSAP